MPGRVINPKSAFLVVSFLFIITVLSNTAQSTPLSVIASQQSRSETTENVQSPSDTTSLIATLSDEQVRKLLIEELRKNSRETQSDSVLIDEIPGPGALFSGLLYSLSQKSDSSEKKVQQLFASIPEIIPDLSKVFLTL